jgi:hypothetical protein
MATAEAWTADTRLSRAVWELRCTRKTPEIILEHWRGPGRRSHHGNHTGETGSALTEVQWLSVNTILMPTSNAFPLVIFA